MTRSISTIYLEVQTTPTWAATDLAEILANYFQGIGAKAFQDPDRPERWQLGEANNYWLYELEEGHWRVNMRHGWDEDRVNAVGLLVESRYRIRFTERS